MVRSTDARSIAFHGTSTPHRAPTPSFFADVWSCGIGEVGGSTFRCPRKEALDDVQKNGEGD